MITNHKKYEEQRGANEEQKIANQLKEIKSEAIKMEFACSVCKYTTDKKVNITRHLNSTRKCGEGIPEIIEIPTEIICEYCYKEFATGPNLKRHLKTCKVKKDNLVAELAKKTTKFLNLKHY